MMGQADEPERGALTVPLETVGTASSRRTRFALAIWAVGLAGIAWVGWSARDVEAPTVEPPIETASTAAGTTVAPTQPASVAERASTMVVRRRTFGEDGLVGGIVFGDNVPRLTQADIERDGYRRFWIPPAPGVEPAGPHLKR